MIQDRAIAVALILSIVGAVLFVVAYASGGDRLYEGVSIALSAAGLCGAAVGWAFWILPDEQVEEERSLRSAQDEQDEREAVAELRDAGFDVTRKKMLARLLYTALGFFGIALVVPIRSLGPAIGEAPFHTKWRKGLRMEREDGTFVKVSDLNVDSVATVFPEGAAGDEQAQTVLIRIPDGLAQSANGYIAYSKVCTHAGCPVALYRAGAKQLMCPCHQSVFDVVRDGEVVFGPADHALPRLPIEVGDDGYLRAAGDFPRPVGPGFWNESV
jgi:ubiquinol-cytochrome c reductase iron-sulfur subunit